MKLGSSNAGGTEGGVRTSSNWTSSVLYSRLFEHEPETFLRRMPGRESFLFQTSEGRRVVKRYRSSAGREGWRERLSGRPARSEGRREYDNLVALAVEGVRVPRVVAHVENDAARSLFARSRAGRSAVVMECIEHSGDLRTSFSVADPSERARLAAQLALIVRRLHGRGFYHRDLYLEHFLVDAEGALVLIDVGRVRRERAPRRRWLVKDLAALELSAPTNLTRTERLRFLMTYLGQRAEAKGKEVWKSWARDVLRKAARLGAHQPRFSDPNARTGLQGLEKAGERAR